MTTYALDTNILSFMIKQNVGIINSFRKANDAGSIFVIPVTVYYEIRRGLLAVNAATQMKEFEKLCETFYVKEMCIDSWEKAAQIWG